MGHLSNAVIYFIGVNVVAFIIGFLAYLTRAHDDYTPIKKEGEEGFFITFFRKKWVFEVSLLILGIVAFIPLAIYFTIYIALSGSALIMIAYWFFFKKKSVKPPDQKPVDKKDEKKPEVKKKPAKYGDFAGPFTWLWIFIICFVVIVVIKLWFYIPVIMLIQNTYAILPLWVCAIVVLAFIYEVLPIIFGIVFVRNDTFLFGIGTTILIVLWHMPIGQ